MSVLCESAQRKISLDLAKFLGSDRPGRLEPTLDFAGRQKCLAQQ